MIWHPACGEENEISHPWSQTTACFLFIASYPAFLRLGLFHTVSDKNLRRGKAGYEASHKQRDTFFLPNLEFSARKGARSSKSSSLHVHNIIVSICMTLYYIVHCNHFHGNPRLAAVYTVAVAILNKRCVIGLVSLQWWDVFRQWVNDPLSPCTDLIKF